MYAHVYDMKAYGAYWEEERRGNREGAEEQTVHVFLYAEVTQADAYDTKAERDCVAGRTGTGKSGEGPMWATHSVNCDQESPQFVP